MRPKSPGDVFELTAAEMVQVRGIAILLAMPHLKHNFSSALRHALSHYCMFRAIDSQLDLSPDVNLGDERGQDLIISRAAGGDGYIVTIRPSRRIVQ